MTGLSACAAFATALDNNGLEIGVNESPDAVSEQKVRKIIYDDNDGQLKVIFEGTKISPGLYYTYKVDTFGFTKFGHVFTGWNTKADGSGHAYGEEDYFITAADVTTLYAQWEYDGKTKYNVSYYNDESLDYKADKVTPGALYIIKDGKAAGLEKEGYIVAHWNAARDGSEQEYLAGDEVTVNSTLSLWPQWVGSEEKYQVVYDANKGENNYAHENLPPAARYTVLSAEATGVTRNGYSFTGWNTRADGSGTSWEPDEVTILKVT